jgi:hypothetical protein
LLIKQLNTCNGDVDWLLKNYAYTTNAGSTQVFNEKNATQIAVTQQQLEAIMKQFCKELGDMPAL